MTDSTKSMRLQVTVPKCDAIVFEWVGVQNSISESIRAVIKDYVARRGMTDAACQPMMIMDDIPETDSRDVESLVSEYNDLTDATVEEEFGLENASEMSAALQIGYESSISNSSEETFDEFRPVIDELPLDETIFDFSNQAIMGNAHPDNCLNAAIVPPTQNNLTDLERLKYNVRSLVEKQ